MNRGRVEICIPISGVIGEDYRVVGPPEFDMVQPLEYVSGGPAGRWTMRWRFGDKQLVIEN